MPDDEKIQKLTETILDLKDKLDYNQIQRRNSTDSLIEGYELRLSQASLVQGGHRSKKKNLRLL